MTMTTGHTVWEIWLIGTIVLLLCGVPLSIIRPKNLRPRDLLWLLVWPGLVVAFIIAAMIGRERLERIANRKGEK